MDIRHLQKELLRLRVISEDTGADPRVFDCLDELEGWVDGAIGEMGRPLKVKEYAEKNRRNVQVVYRDIRAGNIPGAKKVGGSWRIFPVE